MAIETFKGGGVPITRDVRHKPFTYVPTFTEYLQKVGREVVIYAENMSTNQSETAYIVPVGKSVYVLDVQHSMSNYYKPAAAIVQNSSFIQLDAFRKFTALHSPNDLQVTVATSISFNPPIKLSSGQEILVYKNVGTAQTRVSGCIRFIEVDTDVLSSL